MAVAVQSYPTTAGLYPGVSLEEYLAWPYCSQSLLKTIRDRSPAHAREERDNPPAPTDAQRLGDAIHRAVLQPDLFYKEFVCAPEGDRRTKAVREAWEELAQENPEATILHPDEFHACRFIRDAVHSHPTASKLLKGAEFELSAVWEDNVPGYTPFLSKGRFDIVNRRLRLLADLKTTKDASPRSFRRDIYRYFYYGQAGHYLSGARALGIDVDAFLIIAVEKKPPYGMAVYSLKGEALKAAIDELTQLKSFYAECLARDAWPAYPTDIQEIDLATWAYYEIEERVS